MEAPLKVWIATSGLRLHTLKSSIIRQQGLRNSDPVREHTRFCSFSYVSARDIPAFQVASLFSSIVLLLRAYCCCCSLRSMHIYTNPLSYCLLITLDETEMEAT